MHSRVWAARFVAAAGLLFASGLLDGEGALQGAYQATELTQSVVVDRHGRVGVVRLGGDAADLEAVHHAVDRLLEEP